MLPFQNVIRQSSHRKSQYGSWRKFIFEIFLFFCNFCSELLNDLHLSDSDDGGGGGNFGGNSGADVGGMAGNIGSNVSASVAANLGGNTQDRKKPLSFPDP